MQAASPSLGRGLRAGGAANGRSAARAHAPSDEIEGLLGRIRDLVQARERLRAQGAGDAEVAGCSAAIARLQERLAGAVRRRLATEDARAAPGRALP
jgi:hypothetical protein